ncbi:MAG: helix-turn-helix transcriptional regulator [Clostridia bacterium]|nr:helix-turn-helix transcriptional regulator [Clostridia bacterium]
MEQIFGDRLRMIRKRRGMTQSALAQALGVTVQTVVRYESLRLEELRPGRLEAIAAALDVSPQELSGAGWDPVEDEIQVLTRGLRNMDPAQRENLIQLMMPFVLQYQKKEAVDHG